MKTLLRWLNALKAGPDGRGAWLPPLGTTLFVCIFTGVFGVTSGYAVFFLLLEESAHPLKFVGALGVAAVLSLIFEFVHHLIDHGDKELSRHFSVSRVIISLSMLAMAEFFVMASHSTVMLHGES